ncbi:MAG: hypothetical protein J0M26_04910 [Planctomycetes bacterium]|nr:hypothetical protein [Planctomycetota bacterium]
MFDLFTEPRYFPELTTKQSCVLVGGRGTGKTTALRGLSYAGQSALAKKMGEPISRTSDFIGLYHRVNTNHVAAFSGAGVKDEEWIRPFAHYFNLLLCELILEYVSWYELSVAPVSDASPHLVRRVSKSLHLGEIDRFDLLHQALIESRLDFESQVNNIVDEQSLRLSLQQRPVELLCEATLSSGCFKGRHFFFLLDEYENLLPYQQKVANTYIKHSNGQYFFKIGVKELGWTCKTTLQASEQLIAPADYALIRISDRMTGDVFVKFAKDVCETRLAQVRINGETISTELEKALPGISNEDEAIALGVLEHTKRIESENLQELAREDIDAFLGLTPLQKYFVHAWAKSHDSTLSDELRFVREQPKKFKERFDNHKYATLFSIRKRKRGIDKFYCGLDTYALLACGNIRYMLELVDQSFIAHLRDGGDLSSPVPPETQTITAQRVGAVNLSELEGLSVNGAKLTKMLLAVGRIFQQMAIDPFGHAPEVNQFRLTTVTPQVDELLRHAVMHLAVVRFPGTKLGGPSETLDFDYAIHPIFAAMFEFSPRRKRKMDISAEELATLIENPKESIRYHLKQHKRETITQLPQQLTLFSRFYGYED